MLLGCIIDSIFSGEYVTINKAHFCIKGPELINSAHGSNPTAHDEMYPNQYQPCRAGCFDVYALTIGQYIIAS